MRVNVTQHLERDAMPKAANYEEVRVRGDTQALQRVRDLLFGEARTLHVCFLAL